MRRALLASIMLVVLGSASHAEERGVDSARCKDAIGAIVRLTNATVEHSSPSGDNMFMRHPYAKDIVLSCSSYQPNLNISLGYAGAYPPQLFYALVAATGSTVVPDSISKLEAAAIKCQTKALKDPDEMATINTAHAALDCHAFTRDGGSTLITVGAKQPE